MDAYEQMDDEDEISIDELLAMIGKHIPMITIIFIAVVALAFAYIKVATPKYESKASILVDPIRESSSMDSLLGMGMGNSTKIATEVEILTSDTAIAHALERLDLSSYHTKAGVPYDDEDIYGGLNAVEKAKKILDSKNVSETNVVELSFRDPSAAFAHDFLEALCASYNEVLTDIARDSKTAQRKFIESQIPVNEERLEKATDELGAFRKETGAIQLTEKTALWVRESVYYQLKMEPLNLEIKECDQRLEDPSLPRMDEQAIKADARIAELLDNLYDAQEELAMYEAVTALGVVNATSGSTATTGASPQQSQRLSDLQGTVLDLKKSLVARLTTLSHGSALAAQIWTNRLNAETQIQVLEARQKEFTNELDTLPDIESQQAKLERNVKVFEEVGLRLQDMLAETRLLEASISRNVTVVDAASHPVKPVSPKKLIIMVVAAFGGLVLGMVIALLIEFHNDAIDTKDQLARICGKDVPILSWIPYFHMDRSLHIPSLIVEHDGSSFEAERYKLVANRMYRDGAHGLVYTITSTNMSEGKSTLVANTALAISQMGKKVLLMDGDLRRPSMMDYFGLDRKGCKGLNDVVVHGAALEEALIRPLANEPNLDILPAGTGVKVPSAVFTNIHFFRLLDRLKQIYDYIIIDAPPLLYGSELITLGKHTDGMLIAVRASVSTQTNLKELLSNLKASDIPITGVVFTECVHASVAGVSGGGSYSYGYGYGYGYGYASSQNGKKKRKQKHHTTAWLQRRYKRDLKLRAKDEMKPKKLEKPTLAYPEGYFAKAEQSAAVQVSSPVSDEGQELVSAEDALAALEQNPDAAGKR